MPGIICIINGSEEPLIDNMCSSIKHEPWYKIEKHIFQQFAVARVHLGIVNPEPQPIFNEDKSLCIFMDGEIFGYEGKKRYLESRHEFKINNDPEFCLHLYEEIGERFVEKLNGSFVILIFDLNEQKLLIANDRYGLRPLYYARVEDRIYFAPEVKAILQDRNFNKTINTAAVAEFFTFGHLLGNKTFFKGIDVCPPASIFTYQNGEFEIKQYWDFKYEEDTDSNNSEVYYATELVKLFKQAVERRMKGNHRFGVLLSGGLDSRSVLAAIDKQHYPIHTITVPNIDDSYKIAKKVSEKRGATHKQLELRKDYLSSYAEKGVYLTDGMLNISHLHYISTLDEIRGCGDVIFNGAGGTLLGGTYINKSIIFSKNDNDLIEVLNIREKEELMKELFSEVFYKEVKSVFLKSLERELEKSNNKLTGNRYDYFELRNRGRRVTGMVFNYHRSKFEDRMPFYDNDFVDFNLKTPPELRYNHRIYINFLKRLAPDLAKIPYNLTGIRADAPVFLYNLGRFIKIRKLKRRLRNITRGLICKSIKAGYPDIDEWIREDFKLNKFFKDIILDERTLNRGYFNREYVTRVFNEHMSRKKDCSELLCAIVTFELWHRLFIDDEKT